MDSIENFNSKEVASGNQKVGSLVIHSTTMYFVINIQKQNEYKVKIHNPVIVVPNYNALMWRNLRQTSHMWFWAYETIWINLG